MLAETHEYIHIYLLPAGRRIRIGSVFQAELFAIHMTYISLSSVRDEMIYVCSDRLLELSCPLWSHLNAGVEGNKEAHRLAKIAWAGALPACLAWKGTAHVLSFSGSISI